MPYEFYKVAHILGLLMVFGGLAALWGAFAMGAPPEKRFYKSIARFHGIGMLLIAITGFGMLARLGLMAALPGWAYVKMVIWLALGAAVTLVKRKAGWGMSLLSGLVLLGTLAAYMAIVKPF